MNAFGIKFNGEEMDSFYFLHIMKCGGTFIEKNILNPLRQPLNLNNINVINPNLLGWHGLWQNSINESTYVVSGIRNPVKRTISHFCHDNNNNDSVSDCMNWIEKKYNFLKNFQTKNLMYTNDDIYGYDSCINSFKFNNFVIDKKELYEKIKRINLLIKTDVMTHEDINLYLKKICTDLNLKITNNTQVRPSFSSQFSKNIFSKLSKKEIGYIEELNDIDMEIWSNL